MMTATTTVIMHLNQTQVTSMYYYSMCGQRKGLECHEFVDLTDKKDIVGFHKTKTGYLDHAEIEGFTLFLKHRTGALGRSRGIGVAIEMEDGCDYILLIKLCKTLFDNEQDVF